VLSADWAIQYYDVVDFEILQKKPVAVNAMIWIPKCRKHIFLKYCTIKYSHKSKNKFKKELVPYTDKLLISPPHYLK
jgi:hypothetical protein